MLDGDSFEQPEHLNQQLYVVRIMSRLYKISKSPMDRVVVKHNVEWLGESYMDCHIIADGLFRLLFPGVTLDVDRQYLIQSDTSQVEISVVE